MLNLNYILLMFDNFNKGMINLNFNNALLESMEKTQIGKGKAIKISDILIDPISLLEGIVIVNRKSNKIIDKIVAYVCEVILATFIGWALNLIILVITPGIIHTNNGLIDIIAFMIFPIIIVIINKKKDYNLASYLKIFILLFSLFKLFTIKRIIKEFITVTILGVTLACSIFYEVTKLFHFNQDMTIKIGVFISLISYFSIYVLTIELKENELDAICLKIVYVIINAFVLVYANFRDIEADKLLNGSYNFKVVTISLLVITQMFNIISIAKSYHTLVINKIEDRTKEYEEVKDTLSAEDVQNYNVLFSELYLYAPNSRVKTFTEYFSEFKNNSTIVKRKFKGANNKNKLKFTFFLCTSICISLVEIIMSNRYMFKQLTLKNFIMSLFMIAIIGFLFLILIIIIEDKPILAFFYDTKNKLKNKYLHSDLELISQDKTNYININRKLTKLMRNLVIASISCLSFIILIKYTSIINKDLKPLLIFISIFVSMFLCYIINIKLNKNLCEEISKYTPNHIKYRILKIIMRIVNFLLVLGMLLLHTFFLKLL